MKLKKLICKYKGCEWSTFDTKYGNYVERKYICVRCGKEHIIKYYN